MAAKRNPKEHHHLNVRERKGERIPHILARDP